MSRKAKIQVREVLPDEVYNSKIITSVINKIMWEGKKHLAKTIVYDALKLVEKKTEKPGIEVFEQALENVMPHLQLKVRRIGGANYQVPAEVQPKRKLMLGLRWLINYARLRNEKSMVECLANEIIDAANSTGGAFKKKEDTHKMAEANKAFAHYRW